MKTIYNIFYATAWARHTWQKQLEKIKPEGGSDRQRRLLYTTLCGNNVIEGWFVDHDSLCKNKSLTVETY